MLKKCAVMAALLLALSPAAAHADWLFTPNIGSTFGADAKNHEQLTYGAAIGWMGAGIAGWELDLSYTPSFFDTSFSLDPVDNNNVVSWMANVIVGAPVGGQHGGGIRPYFTGGVGVLQTQVGTNEDLFHVDNNEFGFNVGGGAMGFVSDHVGFRGDIKYTRSLQKTEDSFEFSQGKFDYWRATGGMTFRW